MNWYWVYGYIFVAFHAIIYEFCFITYMLYCDKISSLLQSDKSSNKMSCKSVDFQLKIHEIWFVTCIPLAKLMNQHLFGLV